MKYRNFLWQGGAIAMATWLVAGTLLAASAQETPLPPFPPKQDTLPVPPPPGAIVQLGPETNNFVSRHGGPIDWPLEEGVVTSTQLPGNINHIATRTHFRDADIHVEFKLPEKGSGNSGIYIHGNYELQIVNSHGKEEITMDDMGALYGFSKARVNAALPPGQWQVYDIRYRAPRRGDDGKITEPGTVTAYLNGQLVQENTTFEEPRSSFHMYRHGVTPYLRTIGKIKQQKLTAPLFLQDHNNAVQFRNVWIVPLDDQAYEYASPDPVPGEDGLVQLFDGKTFTGWEGDIEQTWRIENGMLVAGSLDQAAPRNEFLSTTARYADFDLTLQYRIEGEEKVNAGVQFRTRRIPNHHEVAGYQADIGPGYYGALYDESRRNRILAAPDQETVNQALAAVGEDGWHTYRIRAQGPRIQLWLNGVATVDYREEEPKIERDGVIAVQIHGGMKARIAYRQLQLKPL